MVIQRIQTLYLLLAAILVTVFCFVPFSSCVTKVPELDIVRIQTFVPKDMIAYLIPGLVAALLLFVDIFMFKNLRRQRLIILVSLLLMAFDMVMLTLASTLSRTSFTFQAGFYLLPVAIILAVMAFVAIGRDQKRLRSYDRLR